MTPITAIKTCFAKTVTLSGRASRSEFWWFTGFVVLAIIILGNLAENLDTILHPQFYQNWREVFEVVVTLAILALFVPLATAIVRRFHDAGWSGTRAAILIGALIASLVLSSTMLYLSMSPVPADNPDQNTAMLMTITFLPIGIAMITGLITLWGCLKPSQPGPNKYGPNPHEVTP